MSMKAALVGQRFERWVVLGEAAPSGKNRRVRCRCDCGTERDVFYAALKAKTGGSRSCGCLKIERASGRTPANATHRMSRTPTYVCWQAMRNRCGNPTNKNYADYGGRGIRVCAEWDSSFEAFLRDMGEQPAGLTLERKDVNDDYRPGNCCWADRTVQARNRQYNALVTLNGVTKTIAEWAVETGMGAQALYWRLHRGLPPEEILAHEDRRRPTVLTLDGQTHTLSEWATLTGVKLKTLHYRLRAGWPAERTLSR